MDEDLDQGLGETVRAVDSYLTNENRQKMGKTSSGKGDSKPERIVLLLGGLILLALLVLVARTYRSQNNTLLEDLNIVSRDVAALAKRLGTLEERANTLETSRKDLEQSIIVAERSAKTSSADIRELAQKIGEFEKRMASLEEETIPQIERGHYEVRPGDTLYRISQKYGISVDELRHLNGLDPRHVIYPGQKLVISRSNKK